MPGSWINCKLNVVSPLKAASIRGALIWGAQSVKCLTFGSGHDLMVREFEPRVGVCADSEKPAWDSLFLSLSFSLAPAHAVSVSLKINK